MTRGWRTPRSGKISPPRTREDEPMLNLDGTLPAAAAPHTRRCTAGSGVPGLAATVRPAHAGMNRRRPGSGWSTCVARPAAAGMNRIPRRCSAAWSHPPRTRGDLAFDNSREDAAGSPAIFTAVKIAPAHAGMNPRSPQASTDDWDPPRTRGDAPRKNSLSSSCSSPAPPHTRGCSTGQDRRHRSLRARPEHSGMNRRGRKATIGPTSPPRKRGDAPHYEPEFARWVWSAPHARRSAHAGMHLTVRRADRRRSGPPRTRGDAPNAMMPCAA